MTLSALSCGGPPSSHTAASWRIGRVCLDILNEPLKSADVEFDKHGAWAPNYEEQGTVMGMNGGLINIEITDPRMKDTRALIEERDLSIDYKISSFPAPHVNTVHVSLEGIAGNNIRVLAASLGGGMFRIYTINEFDVEVRGDYYELLIFGNNDKTITDKIG